MEQVTNAIQKAKDKTHSVLLGVSLRGWIVLIIVVTVCYMSLKALEVKEPLYSLVFLTVGYYFGQSKQTQNKPLVNQ